MIRIADYFQRFALARIDPSLACQALFSLKVRGEETRQ